MKSLITFRVIALWTVAFIASSADASAGEKPRAHQSWQQKIWDRPSRPIVRPGEQAGPARAIGLGIDTDNLHQEFDGISVISNFPTTRRDWFDYPIQASPEIRLNYLDKFLAKAEHDQGVACVIDRVIGRLMCARRGTSSAVVLQTIRPFGNHGYAVHEHMLDDRQSGLWPITVGDEVSVILGNADLATALEDEVIRGELATRDSKILIQDPWFTLVSQHKLAKGIYYSASVQPYPHSLSQAIMGERDPQIFSAGSCSIRHEFSEDRCWSLSLSPQLELLALLDGHGKRPGGHEFADWALAMLQKEMMDFPVTGSMVEQEECLKNKVANIYKASQDPALSVGQQQGATILLALVSRQGYVIMVWFGDSSGAVLDITDNQALFITEPRWACHPGAILERLEDACGSKFISGNYLWTNSEPDEIRLGLEPHLEPIDSLGDRDCHQQVYTRHLTPAAQTIEVAPGHQFAVVLITDGFESAAFTLDPSDVPEISGPVYGIADSLPPDLEAPKSPPGLPLFDAAGDQPMMSTTRRKQLEDIARERWPDLLKHYPVDSPVLSAVDIVRVFVEKQQPFLRSWRNFLRLIAATHPDDLGPCLRRACRGRKSCDDATVLAVRYSADEV